MTLIVPNHHNPDIHPTDGVDPGLHQAYGLILDYLARNGDLSAADKSNYADTQVRAAKAFTSMVKTRTEINHELRHLLRTGFPMEDHDDDYVPGLITQGPILVYSMCPHHLLQVGYSVVVSYIPEKNGTVLGLSKLARIVKTLSKRPVLQEQLASDIADSLCWHQGQITPGIKSSGSAVSLIGKHSCMACRGVESEALTSVTELRGSFWEPYMELKFNNAIDLLYRKG